MKTKGKGIKTQKTKKEKLTSSDSDFVSLGKRMRELRLKKGYKSFEIFAYDNDLPRVLYGNYEKGVGNITYKNLLKVIRALNVSVKEFFSEGFE
ncbi:MAG: helix-turn-helix domain-containing protein [Bacteroidota bacterium]